MNLKEKYGDWGIILGATEGIGKAFCEAIAEGGMNVVMVGRRAEKLEELGKEIAEKYAVDYKVIRADFSEADSADKVIEATKDLDMGFMSYVACLHKFGKLQDTSMEDHMKMIQVNILTFLNFMHHYTKLFAAKDKGAIINVSSLTGITSSPYNAEYGAGKSYILKLTEAVAYECRNTGVDVEVITAGSTVTPSWLKNQPGGPAGDAARKAAMLPEDVVKEAFEALGKKRSIIAGERNRATVKHWQCDMTADEVAEYMGKFYE